MTPQCAGDERNRGDEHITVLIDREGPVVYQPACTALLGLGGLAKRSNSYELGIAYKLPTAADADALPTPRPPSPLQAIIGFAGRRVIEQTLQEQLPDDFQVGAQRVAEGG